MGSTASASCAPPQAFSPPAGFDGATYYAHAFGITRPDNGTAPQEIVLRFAPTQGRYVLGYPLHASQAGTAANDTEIRLALPVFDTHDLRMKLLSYGPKVQVLAPAALRDWLQVQHTATYSYLKPEAPTG